MSVHVRTAARPPLSAPYLISVVFTMLGFRGMAAWFFPTVNLSQ